MVAPPASAHTQHQAFRRLRVLVPAAAALVLGACGDASRSDPDNATCTTPTPGVGETQAHGDHREVVVHFTCEGGIQVASVYLPAGPGPHPGVVWVHGNGPQTRLHYGPGVTGALVQAGIAILSYDKRGLGDSQGVCCPGDQGHFNLLAADAMGAINALRAMPDINPNQVGLIGASQAGWIIPIAAARSPDVAFTAVVDGPAVTQSEELLYSFLTGEEGGGGGVLSRQAINYR